MLLRSNANCRRFDQQCDRAFQSAIKRLRLDHTVDIGFSLEDLAALGRASPHALRHTFGTLAVADGMPIDVAQAVLGHKDRATTAIYVQAKTKRVVEEGAKVFCEEARKKTLKRWRHCQVCLFSMHPS